MLSVTKTDNPLNGTCATREMLGETSETPAAAKVDFADFVNLLCCQSGIVVVFAIAGLGYYARMSSLFHHVLRILFWRAKKQMSGIDTGWIVAIGTIMANLQAVRDRAICQFPRIAMGRYLEMPAKAVAPITKIGFPANPEPATVWPASFVDVIPKAFSRISLVAFAVTRNITARLILDALVFSSCVFGEGGFLAAPAHAQSARIRIFESCDWRLVMTGDEAHWIAFYMSFCAVGSCGNLGLLPASAFAKTVRDFVRGIMGLHRNLSFLVPSLGTIPVVAGAISIGSYSCNYTTSLLVREVSDWSDFE